MKAPTLPERLSHLESVIKNGQQTFVEVGLALAEIKDGRLYKEAGYKTFEDYCREKWGWNRRRAYDYIEAADAVKSLPENVQHAAQNMRQATELSKSPPEKRAQVVEVAATKAEAEKRPMTAQDVKEARIAVCEPPAADPAANEAQEAPAPVLIVDPSITRLAKNIFAIQVEERIDVAINDGSVDQLKCVKLALEVGLKKVSAAINNKRQA